MGNQVSKTSLGQGFSILKNRKAGAMKHKLEPRGGAKEALQRPEDNEEDIEDSETALEELAEETALAYLCDALTSGLELRDYILTALEEAYEQGKADASNRG